MDLYHRLMPTDLIKGITKAGMMLIDKITVITEVGLRHWPLQPWLVAWFMQRDLCTPTRPLSCCPLCTWNRHEWPIFAKSISNTIQTLDLAPSLGKWFLIDSNALI